MRGLFVTATDTGVGKTEVSCALLRDARGRGLDAVAMKPAQSGVGPDEPSDAERLLEACDGVEPLDPDLLSFFNLNTRADLETARALWPDHRPKGSPSRISRA